MSVSRWYQRGNFERTGMKPETPSAVTTNHGRLIWVKSIRDVLTLKEEYRVRGNDDGNTTAKQVPVRTLTTDIKKPAQGRF